ncbi:kinase-like domain-containing protein [Gigaspora rosea]|uniref:Kinase-like domain-containing protein n=1 Tax=Gigaspora rosea TaxID=44941 RepID=A0A397V7C1_9GLOM|nr:kinase-like domain-containing protein [Gigaspora rosea]
MDFHSCEECCQKSSYVYAWCKDCNSRHFQEQFNDWTSGNKVIDKFIKETQLKALNKFQKLEWIAYEQFTDVSFLSKGGFGEIYQATWKDGYIDKWDVGKRDWSRHPNVRVVLKRLYNLNEENKLIEEISNQIKSINIKGGHKVIPCYGITQNPTTQEFMMVMQYAKGGDLRQYLNQNSRDLDWYWKFRILYSILEGLNDIHNAELIHRDLHSGNIVLFGPENAYNAYITDFGFCRPANYDFSNENQVHGIVPYIAPEVLRGFRYTQSADIYSFGILVNEVATGLPPHYDYPHDTTLVLKIIEDFRPMIDTKTTPQLIIELVRRCWDADPLNRPTAQELKKQFDEVLEPNIPYYSCNFQNQSETMANNFQVTESSEGIA